MFKICDWFSLLLLWLFIVLSDLGRKWVWEAEEIPRKICIVSSKVAKTPCKIEREREVTQSCPTLCNPMDGSLPGSAVHGIFQARILEWAAISFSRGSSQSRDRTRVACIADKLFTVWATREALQNWKRNYLSPMRLIKSECIQFLALKHKICSKSQVILFQRLTIVTNIAMNLCF